MARRTQLALQQQLKRERAHSQWLEQHLPQSTQLSLSKERIAVLALQCAVAELTKQKSAAKATLSHSSCEQQCCSEYHYNFCEVGSGVTIVFAGSVVGAEHAATVSASTKPTTTFFIFYPFIA